MAVIPLIGTGSLTQQTLTGQVAIVTGAGGGIGYEAARSLAWLGAKVVIAEVSKSGAEAARRINSEMAAEVAVFIKTDVGSQRDVARLAKRVRRLHGKVDIVLNNATIATLGAVTDVEIKSWDASYRVNLRGPVLLARHFLPEMVKGKYGVFACVNSEGLAYMGAYECFKSAQTHLGQTIDAEMDGKGVFAFTIGPGMVPTATAIKGVDDLARFTGKSASQMHSIVKEHMISVEEAGAGFAAAIALAAKFSGQEISSKQALLAAGIDCGVKRTTIELDSHQIQEALDLCRQVRATLVEQSEGWRQRSVFERQWMFREFKKYSGKPVEQWLDTLIALEQGLEQGDLGKVDAPVQDLAKFYAHLQDLARGYTKNPEELERNLAIIQGWVDSASQLANSLSS